MIFLIMCLGIVALVLLTCTIITVGAIVEKITNKRKGTPLYKVVKIYGADECALMGILTLVVSVAVAFVLLLIGSLVALAIGAINVI